MGLDLRNAGVVDDEGLEQDAFRLVDDLRDHLEHGLGVHPPPKPEGQPPSLADIDVPTMTNDGLAQIYIQYVAYAVFINTRVAEIECMEKVAGSELKKVRSRVEQSLRAGGMKGVEIKATIETHPVVADATIEYNKHYVLKKLVTAYYEVFSKGAQALSRVFELRKLEFQQTLREDNIAKKPRRGSKKASALRHRV